MKDKFDSLVDHLINCGFFLEQAVEILEQMMIERALKITEGNQSAASKLLGIHRNTMQRKLIEYKLASPRRKPPRRAAPAHKKTKAG
jgi:DNA-binding NtrC family response regulator